MAEARGFPGAFLMKRRSRSLVIALVVVVALAGYNITFPAGKSATSNWTFVLTHPTLLLHVIVGIGMLVMAVIALIRSVRGRDRPWMALSVAGLVFVLAAFVSGEDYVMSLQKSALNYMSIGWAGAVIAYGTGWYLGHRWERREEAAPLPGR
jgi:peptidoglycan/LPS O-acetylase OafA/YrhL